MGLISEDNPRNNTRGCFGKHDFCTSNKGTSPIGGGRHGKILFMPTWNRRGGAILRSKYQKFPKI